MSGEKRYRLRGEVGGRMQAFALGTGTRQVGSAGTNDIVLPVRGVSRRHAVLQVEGGSVTVHDEGSRNGTFLDDVRLRRCDARPGCRIRFGPVTLRLEEVDAQDAELAIDFLDVASTPRGLPTQETATIGADAPPAVTEHGGLAWPDDYVVGVSGAAKALHEEMAPLAAGELPVLILGETGVGKECIARILHLSSPRRRGPFVAVNCAAIPADLLEAEMFGIGKGVATGVSERAGKFQAASCGTLFLDEIGEMPAALQAKLLRALQEREVQPVGGPTVPVDIRVLAATNCDLERRMQEGTFRRDLFYRVAGYALRVPPLRARTEDVPAFVAAFLRKTSMEAHKAVRGVSVRALAALAAYDWPGNIRELQHEVRRLAFLCPDGQPIESQMLASHIRAVLAQESPAATPAGDEPATEQLTLGHHLEREERRVICEALAKANGNRSEAARLLGISRNGLAMKMQRLGMQD